MKITLKLKQSINFINLIMIIIINITFIGCKKNAGTSVGNPFTTPVNTICNDLNVCPESAITLIVIEICSKLKICFPNLTESNCQNLVYIQPGLSLVEPSYSNSFQSLYSELQMRQRSLNTTNFLSCQNSISQLSCSSNEITNSFNANNLSDYSKIHQILQTNNLCLNAF